MSNNSSALSRRDAGRFDEGRRLEAEIQGVSAAYPGARQQVL